eukprot:scaffold8763_cov119-Isochrysis_galbana.AAC.4
MLAFSRGVFVSVLSPDLPLCAPAPCAAVHCQATLVASRLATCRAHHKLLPGTWRGLGRMRILASDGVTRPASIREAVAGARLLCDVTGSCS